MDRDSELQRLIDKEAIRDLVLLYSRAIDRKDPGLLRDLYTSDATNLHGDSYNGPADGYCDFIERNLPYMPYSGHHICNHLISVDGDEGNGEVYGLAYHLIPDGAGGQLEDFACPEPELPWNAVQLRGQHKRGRNPTLAADGLRCRGQVTRCLPTSDEGLCRCAGHVSDPLVNGSFPKASYSRNSI